jgi:hypothetical protein
MAKHNTGEPKEVARPEQLESDLPAGLAAPARRALAGAGYARLEQLTRVSEAEVRKLHGMGPKALEQLRRALAARGLSFADVSHQRG